jgi:hypothetical protein
MKNIIKFLGLLSLICFSFFYTDKVMDVALEQDKIMISINNVKDDYREDAIEAIIDNDTIIPGISGREVDIEKSYSNMKSIGLFHENYLVFKDVMPKTTLDDNLDKYIIKANGSKQIISLIFIVDNDSDFNMIYNIAKSKNVKVNLFLDYEYLNKKINSLNKITDVSIYSYGEDGKYTKDNIIYTNNLIERITKKKANYCLVTNKNNSNLKVCSDNKSYTIYPNLIIKDNLLSIVKNGVSKGDLILIDINKNNINQLPSAIEYISAKGLEFEYLDEILSEKK